MKLNISSFNIQNDYNKYNDNKIDEIKEYIYKNKIDIIGLQEVYNKIDVKLKNDINYNYYGKYRFRSRFLLRRINEKNPIMIKNTAINNKTYQLPNLPSLLKRIMTKIEVIIDNKKISVYNTHLDFQFDRVKQKQLNKILEIIKKDSNYVILMGDFNLKTNSEIFNNFINELKKIGIYHVDVMDKTLKISKYHRAIDHIFLSNDIKLLNKKIVKDISISDHYPILIQVKI